ncbi:hypothetical protein Tco_1092947 [Tanacetum coccineum]|uniref:Reverse transcriptase domain-containing protein n=1 Tax=Tanacetum coccineum TaxID=301880 RepID=A0ABQ5ICL7_9ASTR
MNEDYYHEQNSCYDSNYSSFDQTQPPQDSIDHQRFLQALDKIQEKLEEIKRDRRKKIEDMIIEEMRHEQQLVDYQIKDLTNDLEDFNVWGSKVQKREQAYNEEQYFAARRRMLSIPFVDEDDYIPLGDIIAQYSTSKAITPDLPIEEPDNSLSMGDEHLNTTPSIENLIPIPSEFEDISDDTSNVPTCDNNRVNVEFDLVESLINSDTLIVYYSKIDPVLEKFAGELAHIKYVDATPSYSELVNDVDQEEKEFDLEDIFQIQDVILREKLLNVHRLISNIESLKVNPIPDGVLESLFPIPVADSDSFLEESDTSLSHLDNSLPEFETFSDHTEETRSGSTTTHANYSLPEYDSFLFEIEPDQEGLISIDNSNNTLLELPEFESFHFDPSFPRPPPEPPDVEKCLEPEAGILITKVFKGVSKPHDFRADILPTLPTLVSDLTFILFLSSFFSFGSEDTIFDPDIST